MIHSKVTPVGIDVNIQRFQEDLHSYLLEKWSLQTARYNCYGRVDRISDKDGGFFPAWFDGGKDYKEVMGSDKVTVTSFFGVDDRDTITEGRSQSSDVHLVFAVNLKLLKESVAHRADAEVKLDVFQFIRIGNYGFEFKQQVTGIDNVFQEYPGATRNNLKAKDMQPMLWFRFNGVCVYDPVNTIQTPITDVLGE